MTCTRKSETGGGEKRKRKATTIWYVLNISAGWATTALSPASITQSIILSLSKRNVRKLIDQYNIPLDEYPRRCIQQIQDWGEEKKKILNNGEITHERSREYASYIMEAMVTTSPIRLAAT